MKQVSNVAIESRETIYKKLNYIGPLTTKLGNYLKPIISKPLSTRMVLLDEV